MVDGRRAIVIGGSLAGLLTGHLLLKAGWDVTIFERSAGDLADRGAGLGISAELLDVMRRIGIPVRRSYAFEVKCAIWLDQEGRVAHESPRHNQGSAWSIIYQPLRAQFPNERYRPGMTLAAVEHDADSVTAIFADGSKERADLLIAADGVFSTVRRQLLPDVGPRYAGYVAWRGVIEEKDLPASTPDFLLTSYAFSFPEGEFAISLPVPGPNNDQRSGHRRYYFIWYRPINATQQQQLFTDAKGHYHGLTIPPPLIRAAFVKEMREAARRNLSPVLADIVATVAQPLLQAVTDLESPQLVFGRVVLLGDSAFVARPHVVAGVTKAALDACELVDALEAEIRDIDRALARYERHRREFGKAIVTYSRYLGAYLEGQLKPAVERSSAEHHRDPIQVIREYGAPHLIHEASFSAIES